MKDSVGGMAGSVRFKYERASSNNESASSLMPSLRMVAVSTVMLLAAMNACAADEKKSDLLKTFVGELVEITPGKGKFPESFDMGSNDGNSTEKPLHKVTFKYSFSIAKYEVPQNLYESVMGINPSRWKGPRNSVEMMTWNDANEFCGKLTEQLRSAKLIGDDEVIRLPTESEWEYCCRAGTSTRYSFGDDAQKKGDVSPKATLLGEYAWHHGNAAGNDPAVGVLKPNPWGLYDIHGYLWEFTADEWSDDYTQAPVDGSAVKGTANPRVIVLRSGSWKDSFENLTSTARRKSSINMKDDAIGIRCVKAKARR